MNRAFLSIWLWLALVLSTRSADAVRVPPGASEEGDYPFGEVIKTTTGFRVIAFDETRSTHCELLDRLQKVARRAASLAKETGVRKARANEVGNAMEEFVLKAMVAENLEATRPKTQSGRTLSVGYPDFDLNSEPDCYVELKTYNAKTANSTQRTFYYSPSADPKITHDALHLLLAFQMVQTEEDGQSVWRPDRFQITSLDQMVVKLKVEYNQSNRGLYAAPLTLADEPVE
jgi:hypothetical protein